MAEKSMELMFYEEMVDKAVAILAAPLPMVTSSRERDRKERMDMALAVLRGEVHPADAIVPALSDVGMQVSAALGN